MSETEEPTVATTEDPQGDFPEKFDRSDVAKEASAEEPKPKGKRGKKEAKEELDEHSDGIWSATAGGPTVERKVTVHKPYSYKELAADLDWSGDYRELAVLNGIRSGRYSIDPDTKLTVPAAHLPVRELSGNRVAALAEAEEPEEA